MENSEDFPIQDATVYLHPADLITSNHRINRHEKAAKVKVLRYRGRVQLGHKLRTVGHRRVRLIYLLGFLDRIRRDPANWEPTTKALTDGLKDAGVLVDDWHRYVEGPDLRIGPIPHQNNPHTRGRVAITLMIRPPEEV